MRNFNAHVVAWNGIAQDVCTGTRGGERAGCYQYPVAARRNACRGGDNNAIGGVDRDQCRRNIHWARSGNQDRKRWNSGCKVQSGASQAVAIRIRNGDRINVTIAVPYSLDHISVQLPACSAARDCHRRGGLTSAFTWVVVARATCFRFYGGVCWTCQRACAAVLHGPLHAELIPRTRAARGIDPTHHIAACGVFATGGGVQ